MFNRDKIKLIIFDLDGVLIDTKIAHYEALNQAIEEVAGSKFKISWKEHLSKYDGLKTDQKLELLTEEKGLNPNYHHIIWKHKQEYTYVYIAQKIKPSPELHDILLKLRNQNYKLACCSNSIPQTVWGILVNMGISTLFDKVLSNYDVKNSKPHPEMYWRTIIDFKVNPEETLIIEDSPYGLLAASRSCANIMRVSSPQDIAYENIINTINRVEMKKAPKWKDDKLNVLIPMAGAGSRFEQVGYTFPKPLIEVKGKPMIQLVAENLNIDARFIYLVRKEHREKYNLDTLLKLITPNCEIVDVFGVTSGAAVTALYASEYINNDNPLLIANSDQFLEWNSNEFMYKMNETKCDGGIVTFEATHPKWSFAKINDEGLVTQVAEKNPISNIATVGVYYWKKGSDYCKYAHQMIDNDKRVNGEFYICPVFNEAIEDGKQIRIFQIDKMWGLGDPSSLQYYLDNYE